ncbi:MAG: hypothetical protein EBQ89_06420 [Alphaproteobacteria bacterium]|nr:hypothetical protein [Alphaproteobacteria bacterium]
MHTSKHWFLLRDAYEKRPRDFATNPILEQTIALIRRENPKVFVTKLEDRRFFNAPRPGTLYASAVHPFPDELL